MINKNVLLDCNSLKQMLTKDNIVLLDCTMKKSVNAAVVDDSLCIPGAISFPFDEVFENKDSEIPHMMPAIEHFAEVISSMGIDDNSVVVLYDRNGIYASPRVWWMFLVAGHKNVHVLDGGLPQWCKEGGITDSFVSLNNGNSKKFTGKYNAELVYTTNEILENIASNDFQLVDARAESRFKGLGSEPRAGLRSGHIPGAKNLPFAKLLDGNKYKNIDGLANEFEGLQLSKDKLIVYMCGSGVTACILALAGYVIGYEKFSIYDGSWSEWGSKSELPIEL